MEDNKVACARCKDTNVLIVPREHNIDILPCPECTPPLRLCSTDHVPILGHFRVCPLCAALEQLRKAKEKRDGHQDFSY